MRASVSLLIALCAAGFGASDVFAQSDQPPVFRSGVEVMEVDVTVVDSNGNPIRDLRAPEFTVTIDGQPRRVVSAEFISETPADRNAPVAPRDPYVSNNTDRRPGRLIMLVVDRNNIDTSVLRSTIASMSRFVSSLAPDDRVSLITIPPPGPYVDFTTNRAQVLEAITRVVGTEDPLPSRFNISSYEALAFESGVNPIVVQRLLFRVCGDTDPNTMSNCDRDVEQEAGTIAAHIRQQTAASVSALGAVLKSLGDVPGAKSMIVLSQGLMLEGSAAESTALAMLAAESRVNINVMMFISASVSAAQSRASETPNQDRDLRETGLESLASRSRGTLFRVVANPQYIFDRLRSEISSYYLLGVEPTERDRDGRTHQIRVQVGRKGIEVRARRQVKYTVRTPNSWSRDVLMGRVLRSPSANTELPMRVSTYTFRDDGPNKVKVIVAAEIDPESMEKELDLAIGFAMFDDTGKAVLGGQERKIYSANSDLPIRYEIAIGVEPGTYRLRLAAIDLAGKSGSVEREVVAYGMSNHEIAIGDLILSAARQGAKSDLRAPVILRLNDAHLATYTEIYTNKPGTLDTTDVLFEVADSPDGPPLQSVLAELRELKDKTLRQAVAVVPISALPPGRYIARATISRGDKNVGRLARPFEILPRAIGAGGAEGLSTVAPSGAKVEARANPGLVVGARPAAFNKDSVLSPEMLRAVYEVVDKTHPAVKAATARARSGKLDGTAMMALDAGDQSAGSILRGLELFMKGQIDQAANQFSVALRNPPDIALASFYLGACYAAVGRDKEAVSAWERARAARLSLPGMPAVIADAWLRLGQPAQALDPLRAAMQDNPQNEGIRRALATAQSQLGLHEEAYATIGPYLGTHPNDPDALLIALSALYQVRMEGKTLGSADEHKARAAQYAKAYIAAKGEHQALVEKWAEYLAK